MTNSTNDALAQAINALGAVEVAAMLNPILAGFIFGCFAWLLMLALKPRNPDRFQGH